MQKTILVTGGAGFIGANFIHHLWLERPAWRIVNLDALTYAGNLASLNGINVGPRYRFVLGDINDRSLVGQLLVEESPSMIVHLAAESHVDRSIDGPDLFVATNVNGTASLLETARQWWCKLPQAEQSIFRFLYVSTDEVYGTLGATGLFSEASPYTPNSPYAASKAAADHFVRAYHRTYGFPTITTHCSNNYGPYQFPEKLIPLIILNVLAEKPLPVYGDGQQVRDWLYVEDHCRALVSVLDDGAPGEIYNIGGSNELTNLRLVESICDLMADLRPRKTGQSYRELIHHVTDRPGHDRRYAIDAGKIAEQLDWRPKEKLDSGLSKTIVWYLQNLDWCKQIAAGKYQQERLGVAR